LHRSEPEVAADILQVTSHWTSITPLLRKTNLNSRSLAKYLAVLLQKGYLTKMPLGDRTFYKTTLKGEEYIQLVRAVIVFEKDFELHSFKEVK
jgi:predicted transcriptional regulator